jgi:hypothetical protein
LTGLVACGILGYEVALLNLAPGSKKDAGSCRGFPQDKRRPSDPQVVVCERVSGLIRANERLAVQLPAALSRSKGS